ncbi:MAG: hypothetical protein OEV49_01110 [candidate division Zixibacteria bacterium]|nr:hypothetical protein [candidate division Zixibacteria bacterium]MDH3938003.1 hypothetical protein [candidate division Zixibacteria bacterium]MDH4033758.1 hypothetical protein [candidate division Zixibacteria bacterium]
MKKLLALVFIVALVLGVAVSTLTPTVEAAPKCIATCINGWYWVCCPVGGGQWECFWDGPC